MTDIQNDPLFVQELSENFRRMLLIRYFEEALADLFSKGLLGGTSHFCIGQEACAAGVLWGARETDWLVSNHRGHGHILARDLEPERVMAELMGRKNGYCGGRGGSQHLCAMDKCFLGTNGITGGGIPIGAGAALALKKRGGDDVAIVFFGDGAGNQGTFHETLNIASLWKLPVLFVCENNGYGMSNPVTHSTACRHVADRAAGYSMPGVTTDGMDVLNVRQATEDILAPIRAGEGPAILELITYRYSGHSKNDPRVYRTREEEAEWEKKDCLNIAADYLGEAGLTGEEIEAIRQEVRERIEDVVEQSLNEPVGDRAHALGGVYA